MKDKKLILILIALVAVVALMAGIWSATRPDITAGDVTKTKASFTVVVVHADGTEKTFHYQTDEAYLGAVLYAEGLIGADEENAGMFDTVDGEVADWDSDQSYWALYEGEDYAMQGMDTTPVVDGQTYRLVYSRG